MAQPAQKDRFTSARDLLNRGLLDHVFPGAVCLVTKGGERVFSQAVGLKSAESSPVGLETVYDVAGLTTGIVTTTILLKLIEEGKLSLSDKVSRFLQGFGVLGKSKVTVFQLLNHSSGLPAWSPFFEDIIKENAGPRLGIMTSRSARDYVYAEIQRLPLKYDPGTKTLYSDLGIMLLGSIIELLTGMSLDRAAQKYVFAPLQMKSTGYIDLSMVRRRGIHPVTDSIAATEECSWRKRVLCGEVHDDNAWAMGGIAAHAGVFTNAPDLSRFTNELLKVLKGSSNFISPRLLREAWSPTDPNSPYRFGWEIPSKENGLAGIGFSDSTVGMNGFTGCSMWLDPAKDLSIILLTNRVYPSRNNKKINQFRVDFTKDILNAYVG
jgi:CubicO group peptidase (beta-lactamase class C family)